MERSPYGHYGSINGARKWSRYGDKERDKQAERFVRSGGRTKMMSKDHAKIPENIDARL
jgi:hypothetical protein